jgi:hypothetical protein
VKDPTIDVSPKQILQNDVKPGVELVAEKELSAYSRFTKNKYADPLVVRHARDNVANHCSSPSPENNAGVLTRRVFPCVAMASS